MQDAKTIAERRPSGQFSDDKQPLQESPRPKLAKDQIPENPASKTVDVKADNLLLDQLKETDTEGTRILGLTNNLEEDAIAKSIGSPKEGETVVMGTKTPLTQEIVQGEHAFATVD